MKWNWLGRTTIYSKRYHVKKYVLKQAGMGRKDSKKQANGISMSQPNYFYRLDATKNYQFSSEFFQWSTEKLFQRIDSWRWDNATWSM